MLVSTGGNTSSQTSAIVIQGVNSGVINDATLSRFFKRELGMGIALGLILGFITFVRVYAFKHLFLETMVVSISVALIVMLSVLLGSGSAGCIAPHRSGSSVFCRAFFSNFNGHFGNFDILLYSITYFNVINTVFDCKIDN